MPRSQRNTRTKRPERQGSAKTAPTPKCELSNVETKAQARGEPHRTETPRRREASPGTTPRTLPGKNRERERQLTTTVCEREPRAPTQRQNRKEKGGEQRSTPSTETGGQAARKNPTPPTGRTSTPEDQLPEAAHLRKHTQPRRASKSGTSSRSQRPKSNQKGQPQRQRKETRRETCHAPIPAQLSPTQKPDERQTQAEANKQKRAPDPRRTEKGPGPRSARCATANGREPSRGKEPYGNATQNHERKEPPEGKATAKKRPGAQVDGHAPSALGKKKHELKKAKEHTANLGEKDPRMQRTEGQSPGATNHEETRQNANE